MNLDVKIIDIKEIKDFDVATLTDRDLNFKHDMSDAIKNAEKQFEKLDLVLNWSNYIKYFQNTWKIFTIIVQ